MSVMVLGFVALALAFTSPAVSQLSDVTLQRLLDAGLTASHLLELSMNDGCSAPHYAGQEMMISARSPIEGYLYLFYFRADGVVTMMLFPCRHFWGDFPVTVQANSPLTIPPDGARISLSIAPPLGREALLGMVVSAEQTDLVSYFRAYDDHEFGYRTGDQEGFALFLVRRIADLKARGVQCAASVCVFHSMPGVGGTTLSAPAVCDVGPEFRCSSDGLPTGCLPERADIAAMPREQLPDSFGPGEDAVLLSPGHYWGSLGEGDWHDWYRLRAAHGDAFVVWFDPSGLVVDLYLVHDPCGDVLAECLSVRSATTLHVPCYAGVDCPGISECFRDGECCFFVRVVWRGGSGEYRLSILEGTPEVPAP